jgi:hypothetical protein
MEIIQTITSLPPQITQHFDRNLLNYPCVLGDGSHTLWRIYQYILKKLKKKLKHPNSISKFCEMEKQFLEIYAQIEKKELEEEAKNSIKKMFYRFPETKRNRPTLFGRIRYK